MRVTLNVTEGPLAGQSFSFDRHDVFLVGRSPNAHCRLPENDPYFSRVHFMIEVNPPYLRLMDMGSRNGTFVNGRKVETFELRDNDEIKAGHTKLVVRVLKTLEDLQVGAGDACETQEDIVIPDRAGITPGPRVPAVVNKYPPPIKPGGKPIKAESSVINFNIPEELEEEVEYHSAPPAPIPANVPPPRPAGLDPGPTPLPSGAHSEFAELGFQAPKIPGYDLVRAIGQGRMGVVHLARRQADGTEVAIKTILPTEAENHITTQRFLREAEVLRLLDHPNIVKFHETGQAGRALFFAMEYVKGTDVGKVLQDRPRVEPKTAIRLAIQVLDALAHAHARGMVHRDIKPANVLLAEHPDGKRQVKLADFGLARVYRASALSGLTLHGDLGGTPAYMPPEQITSYSQVTPAADQYATAAMLYHMLTGKWVFDLPPMPAGLLVIMTKDPVPLRERRSDLAEGLEKVIHKALAKKPEDRYEDVVAFRQALVPFGK